MEPAYSQKYEKSARDFCKKRANFSKSTKIIANSLQLAAIYWSNLPVCRGFSVTSLTKNKINLSYSMGNDNGKQKSHSYVE
ncbi:TPA: hypothetical protein ACGVTW_004317, partial [Vibrio vulnificus]